MRRCNATRHSPLYRPLSAAGKRALVINDELLGVEQSPHQIADAADRIVGSRDALPGTRKFAFTGKTTQRPQKRPINDLLQLFFIDFYFF